MASLRRTLPLAALAVACVLVFVLAMRVRSLQTLRQDLWRTTTSTYAGLYLPSFSTTTLDGDTLHIGEVGSPQLLLLFTTTCPYCLTSIPYWAGVARTVQAEGLGEVYGIVLDSLHLARAYVAAHDLVYAVAPFPDVRTRAMYRAGGVPEMLVLDGGGRVTYVRRGVVDSQVVADSILDAMRRAADPSEGGVPDAPPLTVDDEDPQGHSFPNEGGDTP